jgi:hypothetical protein
VPFTFGATAEVAFGLTLALDTAMSFAFAYASAVTSASGTSALALAAGLKSSSEFLDVVAGAFEVDEDAALEVEDGLAEVEDSGAESSFDQL